MKNIAPALLVPLLVATAPAPDAPVAAPSEIVAAAPETDWRAISPTDLLVMDLAPDARGHARRVVIQLMPLPFSQGWIGNIRKLAAAHWWDGTSVNRVQDNYVVQWGDADAEDKTKAKALPEALNSRISHRYYVVRGYNCVKTVQSPDDRACTLSAAARLKIEHKRERDAYGVVPSFFEGWPIGIDYSMSEPMPTLGAVLPPSPWSESVAPIHCYGMVGVGRNLPPDTGSGAELYAVIGTPPRHLDRNIALIGRVIQGIEHLSSLPRGTGALGFYETAPERTAITAIRLGPEVPGLPAYEYLSTESASFARYADARANRRDAFFITPAGGADICNIPVPVRRAK